MLESLFKRLADWRLATLLKDSNTGVFSWFAKILRTSFLWNPSGDCFFNSVGCFCIFLKKQLNSYFATMSWRTNRFFFLKHRLIYKRSNSFVYKFSINCQVFKITSSGCTLWSWKLTCLITWTVLFETLFFRYLLMCL